MDLQFIYLVRISQTQVDAGIIAGQITTSTLNLRNLKPSLHPSLHCRSDGIAITLFPDQFQGQPVSTVTHVVPQQVERTCIVGNQDIDVAVIVDVSEGRASADLLNGKVTVG